MLPGRGSLQPAILQHGLRVGWRPSPGFVHGGEILRVAAREDHLPEAVPVCAIQPAVLEESFVSVIGQHLGPEVGVVTSAVAATPDVTEVAGSIARRYVAHVQV